MRNPRLIDRQFDIIRYLTQPDFIFGGEQVGVALQDPALRGMNISLLRLEAEMSFGKRIGKIGQALQHTFKYLGSQRPRIFREFALKHPPETYRRYPEVRAFHDFLLGYWQSNPPDPPFITDIAKLEVAQARIRAFQYAGVGGHSSIPPELEAERPLIRLHPGAEILHMNYELRAVFENGGTIDHAAPRDYHLLVTNLKRGLTARIIEISAEASALLESMREWTVLQQVLAGIPEVSDTRESLQRFLATNVLELAESPLTAPAGDSGRHASTERRGGAKAAHGSP